VFPPCKQRHSLMSVQPGIYVAISLRKAKCKHKSILFCSLSVRFCRHKSVAPLSVGGSADGGRIEKMSRC
jgi:hypothetical protein